MAKKLFVGNLAFATEDASLETLFREAGEVSSVKVIKDRTTGRSRGFAFVEMSNDDEAVQAIERFNGRSLDGRTISVSEAKPQEDRPRGGGGGGFGGGGGGGFGGGGGGGRGGFGGGGGGGRGGFGGGRGGGGGGRY